MQNSDRGLEFTSIVARDIPDAWFQAVHANVRVGHVYKITRGSYEDSERSEFDSFSVRITHPEVRPFEPDIPAHFGFPDPVAPGYIDTYFQEKLLIGVRDDNEDYVYGERLSGIVVKRHNIDGKVVWDDPIEVGPNQIEMVIAMYKKSGYGTNQATMEVGRPEDILLIDPPCLRIIDTRVRYGRLHFFVYFRSWDLWGGFPANLGAIQLLKEYMAEQIGIPPGETYAFSKGLHLYGYVMDMARIRTAFSE